MLPVTHTETPEEASKRQSNFIALRTLEAMISPELFEQVLYEAQRRVDMPKRIDWKGESKPLSFQEVKLNFSHVDQNYLPQLLQSAGDGVGATNAKIIPSSTLKTQSLPILQLDSCQYKNLVLQRKNLHLANFAVDQKRNLRNFEISRFERMKTIFGHSMILDGYNAPIYNVLFDKSGSFVISGADDGIIKIWDKETMNLQASLHSHNDVITDMDISRCNTYLATSSKDGRVIIWDWKNCQKIEELAAHTTTINNIKFFQVKLKSQNAQQKEVDQVEILVTCSDDGTIKVYDESMYTNQASQQSNESQQRRSKRHESQPPKKERFFLTITPEDFRPAPGSRNKKIESVNINSNGLMVAGTNLGDIFVWKLDMAKFKQQQAKSFTWIGSFKKHQKNVHFCTFSPNGKMLFTGSTDGTAKVWNMEFEKGKKGLDAFPGFTEDKLLVTLEEKRVFSKSDKQIYFRNRAGEEVNLAEYRQQKNKWQCDTLTWSCYGRYAIASISGKVDLDDKNQEWSILKIWDSFTNQTIQDIASENNIQLMTYSFVIAPHPKVEEIFLSGSEGGTLCLWNIKQRKLIKKFLEYGVYSFEKYTMNNPFDGKFSPDGSSFIIGSEMGTISLFSSEQTSYQYEATRVEQFYPQDDQKHMLNIYYDRDEEPQICGFSMIPYEAQPPAPLIGKFKNARRMTHEEYERNFAVRNELCMEEEKFIQNQLEEGQRNDFFNNQDPLFNRNYVNDEEEKEFPRIGDRRPRINSQISQIQQQHSNNDASQEDVEMLDQINQAQRQQRRNQGRRMNIRNRVNDQQMRVVRINSNIDPDNSMYDRESDENFEVSSEEAQSDENDIGMISEELSQDDSESDDFVIRTRNARRQRQQENQSANRNRVPQRSSRAERAARRNTLLDDEEEKEVTGKRSKRKAVIDSEDGSMNDFSDDEDYSMDDDDIPKKRLKRNNKQLDDESEDEEESEYGMIKRGSKPQKEQKKEKNQGQTLRRNLRKRDNQKSYKGMDSSEDEYMEEEEEKKEEKPGSQGKKPQKVINDESDDQEFKAQQHVIAQEIKKQKGDEDFELIPEQPNVVLDVAMIQNQHQCGFCNKSEGPLIGPFVRVANFQKGKPDERYYFHAECVELNVYSFFSSAKQKWLNIGKAMEMFSKKSHMCNRCLQKGATARCGQCGKYYHGYICSQLYLLRMVDSTMQCYECRNKENYKKMTGKEIQKVERKATLRQLPRNHLLSSKQRISPYIPQVNDKVYYFFQGHERFISCYNIYYYSGDSEQLPFTFPWKAHDQLLTPTLCRIKSITHTFPSNRILHLLKMFGKDSEIPQQPSIISHIELFIADDPEKIFKLDFFPNNLPDFLVLQSIYESSKIEFTTLMNEGRIIGQTFKERIRPQNQVRVVGILDKEPSQHPNTDWEVIQYNRIENHNLRVRQRRGQEVQEQNELEVMNFWDLNLTNVAQEEDEKANQVSAFTDEQISLIIIAINDYCGGKQEQTKIFKERVTDQVARDYKNIIAAEMYISLIIQRLQNKFYRTYEQFFMDADLIHINAKTYNGEGHDITKLAKKLSEFMKNEAKKLVNSIEDSKRRKYEENKHQVVAQKSAGKLTAPIYKNNSYSSMDYFKQTFQSVKQHEEETKGNSMIPSRSTRRSNQQEVPGMNQQNFTVKIQTGNIDSDPRVTPKASTVPTIGGSLDQLASRRSTRNQGNIIQIRNDNYFNNSAAAQFSTEEKTASKAAFQKYEEEIGNGLLGKRTRSGRVTKILRATLNEDELERQFENEMKELANEEPSMIQPFSTKRVRQH